MSNQQQDHSDQALLWAIQQEPERGLRQAMAAYAPLVRGILQCILPHAPRDVEECLADVFVALWRSAPRISRRGAPVKAWLMVTARNTGIDRYRRLCRRNGTEAFLPEELAETLADLQETAGDAAELVSELVLAMEQPDRDILLRKYYLLQTSKQIAAALGLTEGSVNTRLCRSRSRLRTLLAQKGVDIHA